MNLQNPVRLPPYLRLWKAPEEPQSVLEARLEVDRLIHWQHLVEAARLVLEDGKGITPLCIIELRASLGAAMQLLSSREDDAVRELERTLAEYQSPLSEGGR